MKLKSIIAIAAIGSFAVACNPAKIMREFSDGEKPSSTIVSKTYNFADIRAIDVASGIAVHYSRRNVIEPVRVQGPENVVESLEIDAGSDGLLRLSISGKFRYRSSDNRIHVWVAAPEVNDFVASSGSIIEVTGTLSSVSGLDAKASSGAFISFMDADAAKMNLRASSGAAVEIKSVTAESVDVKASSGAAVSVAGKCGYVDLSASSGGSVDARGLKADKGSASASSGGSVSCSIDKADISKSSGGRVSNRK